MEQIDIGMLWAVIVGWLNEIGSSFVSIFRENVVYIAMVYTTGLFLTGRKGRQIFPVLERISDSKEKALAVFVAATVIAFGFMFFNMKNPELPIYSAKLFVSYLTAVLGYETIHKGIKLILRRLVAK